MDYDIIVVGGGTAGCVLANRLSEDPNITVVVLEAGQDRSRDERVYVPGLSGGVLNNPDFDWQYVAEPDDGINHRRMNHPRGKLVGGSSAINSFSLIYPSVRGMDAWAELGNEGWDWKSVRPYFERFQTIVPPSPEVKKALNIMHGDTNMKTSNGPIQASFPIRALPLQKAWVETFRSLDLENQDDPLEGQSIGGYTNTAHVTGDTHERSHAGSAYLDPVKHRPNLTIQTGVTVQKIVFAKDESSTPVAHAIEYTGADGEVITAHARKEIILAAGTFESPHILELSGIGNPTILSKHGIDVVYANSGVGENLQDHMRISLGFEAADGVPRSNILPPEEARKLYESDRSGPWAEQVVFSFAYLPLQPFMTSDELADLQESCDKYLHNGSGHDSAFLQKRNAFVRDAILLPTEASATGLLVRRPPPGGEDTNCITLNAMLSHPLSRGTVHLQSPEAAIKPRIKFNYYSHPLDTEIHARHALALQKIAQTEPLASFIKADGKRFPASWESLELAKQLITNFTSTNYHPCGTCSMLPEGMGGVVDARLRVHGVKGLRVVDASVIPIIPRGNILTTVYAIAEKGADMISEDLGFHRMI